MASIEMAATALVTRSLSTFSGGAASGPGSGTGEAQTDEESKVTSRKNFKGFVRDILKARADEGRNTTR